MSDFGFYHPLVIHFVIALLIVGVGFRWASFTGYVRLAGGAAIVLIALGTIAAVIAVRSGEDASVAVEALPGTTAAIAAHRWWPPPHATSSYSSSPSSSWRCRCVESRAPPSPAREWRV
jgi:hypothetical protein